MSKAGSRASSLATSFRFLLGVLNVEGDESSMAAPGCFDGRARNCWRQWSRWAASAGPMSGLNVGNRRNCEGTGLGEEDGEEEGESGFHF